MHYFCPVCLSPLQDVQVRRARVGACYTWPEKGAREAGPYFHRYLYARYAVSCVRWRTVLNARVKEGPRIGSCFARAEPIHRK